MSNLYDKYFVQNSISKGKALLIDDIEYHRITKTEVNELIAEMNSNNIFNEDMCDVADKSSWNNNYLKTVSSKFLMGMFSEAYIRHLSDVASYIHKKKQNFKMLCACVLGIVVVIATIVLFWKIIIK